jgi:hypothetical protein
MVVAEEL